MLAIDGDPHDLWTDDDLNAMMGDLLDRPLRYSLAAMGAREDVEGAVGGVVIIVPDMGRRERRSKSENRGVRRFRNRANTTVGGAVVIVPEDRDRIQAFVFDHTTEVVRLTFVEGGP